ncbi:MAG TPA: cytochrome c oxidase subunit 3 family protein [Candidatus Binatus sp.]|jgi:cytochrome c oxidase subunit 3|nr:cytochrome c oxidase subunit 3 family protein [Candidatus Binatus sp.]
MADHATAVAHQFDDVDQQREAATLGMWVFLATEVMLFGGLLTVYTVYRYLYARGFAEGSRQLDLWLGSINTVVLITSSLTMAIGVHGAQVGRRRVLVGSLLLTIVLGAIFLSIKGIEYAHKFEEGLVPGIDFTYAGPEAPHVALFILLYFMLTGVHAIHMVIGIGAVSVVAYLGWRGRFGPSYHTPVELVGLYWHFVDIVWIFLLPLLYLLHH